MIVLQFVKLGSIEVQSESGDGTLAQAKPAGHHTPAGSAWRVLRALCDDHEPKLLLTDPPSDPISLPSARIVVLQQLGEPVVSGVHRDSRVRVRWAFMMIEHGPDINIMQFGKIMKETLNSWFYIVIQQCSRNVCRHGWTL